MKELKCKLYEYVIIHAGKTMWGLDCDIELLMQEILKIESYKQVLESLETTNNCTAKIPTDRIQKIESYLLLLNRKRNNFCRNC